MTTEMPTTEAGLKKLTLPVLRKFAEDLGIDPKQTKPKLIASLLDPPELDDEVDDELEDDELEDTPAEDDEELDDDEDEADDEPIVDGTVTADSIVAAVDKAIDKVEPPEPSGETLTAKQVATRIGTDAKTLRKFFRSPNSTVEAVGQGGRYEFAKEDLELIRSEFTKWNTEKPARAPRGSKAKTTDEPKRKVEDIPEEDLELDDEELEASADEVDDEIEDDEVELDDDELDLELDDEDEK